MLQNKHTLSYLVSYKKNGSKNSLSLPFCICQIKLILTYFDTIKTLAYSFESYMHHNDYYCATFLLKSPIKFLTAVILHLQQSFYRANVIYYLLCTFFGNCNQSFTTTDCIFFSSVKHSICCFTLHFW